MKNKKDIPYILLEIKKKGKETKKIASFRKKPSIKNLRKVILNKGLHIISEECSKMILDGKPDPKIAPVWWILKPND